LEQKSLLTHENAMTLDMRNHVHSAAAVDLWPVVNVPHAVIADAGKCHGAITTRQHRDVSVRQSSATAYDSGLTSHDGVVRPVHHRRPPNSINLGQRHAHTG